MVAGQVRRWSYRAALLLSVGLLAFLLGASVVRYQFWPYPVLWHMFMAAHAARAKLGDARNNEHYFYHRARSAERGVRRLDRARAYDGVTLITWGHTPKAELVTLDGTVVATWSRPFSAVWPDAPQLDGGSTPDELVVWRKTHLFPSGDVLVVYAGLGFPWGHGLAKLDRRSQVVWKLDARAHNNADVGEDGTVYALTHQLHTEPIAGLPAELRPPYLEDYLVVLSSDGELQKKLSVTELFRRSDYAGEIERLQPNIKGDLWHANDIEPLSHELAAQFERFKAGQVLISLRNVDAIAVADLDEERIVWATLGPWRGQHDPDFLSNGHLLLFDNLGHSGPGGRSRVLEIDPLTLGIVWQYAGTAAEPFDCEQRGSQQRLPNGNTLITESYQGRVIEVTPDGDVVWEYLSPYRSPRDPSLVAYAYYAQRFARTDLDFDLDGGAP